MEEDLTKLYRKSTFLKAPQEFVLTFPRSLTELKKNIILTAEIAGLTLLRAAAPKLPPAAPGTVLLGMSDLPLYQVVERFISNTAARAGIDQKTLADVANNGQIPEDTMHYFPEINQWERPFCEICEANGIKREHYALVAAQSSIIFVNAADKFAGLEKKVGFNIALIHVIFGSRTIPFPLAE